jgi:hypothetical protein
MTKTIHIHHVPGRLRLWMPQLKGDRRRAQVACDTAGAITGIAAAYANPATGSLTITYDRRRLQPADLWRALCDQDVVTGSLPILADACVTRAEIRMVPTADIGSEIVETIVGALVDRLIARSVVALVGSLI